jgi:heme exporter protein B
MWRIFWHIVAWDAKLALRSGSEAWHTLAFFVMAATLFPLAIGTDPKILGPIAPATLWVLAMLASLMSLPSLYQRDHEDGSLDQLQLLPVAKETIVLAKCAAHWLTSSLPLLLLTPLLALMLFMPGHEIRILELSLFLGTLIMTALGSVSAMMLLGQSRRPMLLAIITLPLYLPVLLWGASAAMPGSGGEYVLTILPITILAALTLISLPFGIWISAVLLKNSDAA